MLDLHNCMDIQLCGERLLQRLLAMIARIITFYLSAKGRFPMWFAASIIVNTMLMAGFLLVMLGLARVAYGTEE
jgi:hypothetical protein